MMDNNSENFDVCIIGASISGNYLSFLLSKTALKVGVIEEHPNIGLPFQCAGIVSQKLSSLINLPKEIVLNRVSIAKIIAPSGKSIKLSGNECPYIIDRVALDRYFYGKIKSQGNIKYFLGEKFKSFEYLSENEQKYVLIKTSKRKIKSRLLIGCDGPVSSVGELLSVKNDIIYAIQIRVKGDFNQDEAVMYFDPRWNELFGWIVPEGNQIYRVGIASSHHVKDKFKIFLNEIGISFDKKIDQQGGIIPYGIMNKLAFDNILLLGDSAGQVKATTGGGIVMLLTCAKYSASCIIKCFKGNNFSKKFIKRNYEKLCAATVGKQLKIHYVIRSMLEIFTVKDFEKFFQIIKTSRIEHLISIYGDMDFPKDIIVKLLKNPLVFTFLIKFAFNHPNILIRLLKILIK